jgi:hypothetical protein
VHEHKMRHRHSTKVWPRSKKRNKVWCACGFEDQRKVFKGKRRVCAGYVDPRTKKCHQRAIAEAARLAEIETSMADEGEQADMMDEVAFNDAESDVGVEIQQLDDAHDDDAPNDHRV